MNYHTPTFSPSQVPRAHFDDNLFAIIQKGRINVWRNTEIHMSYIENSAQRRARFDIYAKEHLGATTPEEVDAWYNRLFNTAKIYGVSIEPITAQFDVPLDAELTAEITVTDAELPEQPVELGRVALAD